MSGKTIRESWDANAARWIDVAREGRMPSRAVTSPAILNAAAALAPTEYDLGNARVAHGAEASAGFLRAGCRRGLRTGRAVLAYFSYEECSPPLDFGLY